MNAPNPRRTVWAIAGPAILANSSAPLVGLVDTWAIGHLPGASHLAAVGLGSVIFNYLLWAFGFLRMGTTGLVAQAWGAGDQQRLTAEVGRSVLLALGFGTLILVFQAAIWALSLQAMNPPGGVAELTHAYFRIRIWSAPAALLVYALTGVLFGLGRTRQVLVVQLVLNLINGALNLLFVIGLGMGVEGVALGTLIAQWLTAGLAALIVTGLVGGEAMLRAWRRRATWQFSKLGRVMAINGFIFLRTILLMTALAMIMRIAGGLGENAMAASHVVNQYMLLMALGLDGFAHAAEALAGRAWGEASRSRFRHWVVETGKWGFVAALVYALAFALAGNLLTATLTDIVPVRQTVAELMPLIVALPIIAFWCYQFDGVFIGATAAGAMLLTMALAFGVYVLVLGPLTERFGLYGLWLAVLLFMGLRGLFQALWYPRLERRLPSTA